MRLFFLLMTLTFANASIADQPCMDLNATICASSDNEGNANLEEFERIKTSISQKSQERAKARIKNLEIKGLFKKLRLYFASQKIINQEIIKAAHEEIRGFEEDIISDEFINFLRNKLLQEIDRSRSFDNQTKERMKKQVLKVRVLHFQEYMNLVGATEKYIPQLFSSHCGMDGLSVNAFATVIDKSPVVLVCPGLLVMSNLQKSSRDLISSVSFVLIHEFSHHIDSSDFPEAYNGLKSCYAKNHGLKLNISQGQKCFKDNKPCLEEFKKQKASVNLFCRMKKENCLKRNGVFCAANEKRCNQLRLIVPNSRKKKCIDRKAGMSCFERVAKSHLNEVIADLWATNIMYELFSEFSIYEDDALNVIEKNFKVLCDSIDQGIHPSAEFRINTIFFGSLDIQEIIGCYDEPDSLADPCRL